MNQTEILKILDYEKKINEIQKEFKNLEPLLKCAAAFQNEESKIALSHIKAYMLKRKKEITKLEANIEEVKKQLSKKCTHPILVRGDWPYDFECPCCKNNYKEDGIPSSTEYLIKYDLGYWKRRPHINEIVFHSKDVWEAKQSILDYFEPLQYDEDIAIRRIKK